MQVEQIIRMRLDGKSGRAIAAEKGINVTKLKAFVFENKIEDSVRKIKYDRIRAILKPLIAKKMTLKEISAETGMAYSSVVYYADKFKLAEKRPMIRRSKPKPAPTCGITQKQFDLTIHDSKLTASQKQERIEAWEMLFLRAGRLGYRDVHKGLDRGNMVVRATAPCGARADFTLNDEIGRCGSKKCPCGGRYGAGWR